MIAAIILSILVISSSPAFLDLKNTFLAAARNFKSSIISTHLIVRLSMGAATGVAAAGAAAVSGAGVGFAAGLRAINFCSKSGL